MSPFTDENYTRGKKIAVWVNIKGRRRDQTFSRVLGPSSNAVLTASTQQYPFQKTQPAVDAKYTDTVLRWQKKGADPFWTRLLQELFLLCQLASPKPHPERAGCGRDLGGRPICKSFRCRADVYVHSPSRTGGSGSAGKGGQDWTGYGIAGGFHNATDN